MTDPVYPYRYEGVYTFRYENGDKTVTVEVGGEKTLPVLLEQIQYFLQACGYSFDLNEHIEVVDNSYTDDAQLADWANADSDGWDEEEKDPHWQADGQQWQTNGWDETGIDGPTEFGFNGTKESDFNVGNMRSDPVYGAIPPAPRSK